MRGFPKFRMVELLIPGVSSSGGNVGTTFKFTDQPDLRYARVLAIETYTAGDIANTFPSNYPLITGAQLSKLALVLETNDTDITDESQGSHGRFQTTTQTTKWLPLASIHRIQNSSNDAFARQLLELANTYVVWDKSFIQVVNGGLGNTTDVGVAIGVYYTFLDDKGQPIKRT